MGNKQQETKNHKKYKIIIGMIYRTTVDGRRTTDLTVFDTVVVQCVRRARAIYIHLLLQLHSLPIIFRPDVYTRHLFSVSVKCEPEEGILPCRRTWRDGYLFLDENALLSSVIYDL
jgi:hypothetical protein